MKSVQLPLTISRVVVYIAFLSLAIASKAQTPVPAKSQSKPMLIEGGTAHLGNGSIIENCAVAFENGVLTIVEQGSPEIDRASYEVIDASGHHLYPGFILPNSQLGLTEISSIRAMSDFNERGLINPNVRSIISYNTDSEYVPTMRFNGILVAETTPTGGLIPGTSSLVEMDGWNWEDACHSMDIGVHLNWPNRTSRNFDFNTFTIEEKKNKNYEKHKSDLTKHFADAMVYGNSENPEVNLKLEAMKGLFDGTKILFIHAGSAKEIVESVLFAKQNDVQKIVLFGDSDILHVADFLVTHQIPVILPPTHSLPSRADEDIDLPYRLPHLLTQAGLEVSLSHTGGQGNARNLPFYAGTAAAYGMEKEEALKMITLHPARALGVDDRLGSLEVGKEATLFIAQGDALDIRGNILTHAFIRGRLITLPAKQQELYRRYSEKYGHTTE